MKALSFSQPWLWSMERPQAEGPKDIENRFWPMGIDDIGTDIAFHAAKSFDKKPIWSFGGEKVTAEQYIRRMGLEPPMSFASYPKSAITSVGRLDRIITETKTLTDRQEHWYFGPEIEGRTIYGHVFTHVRVLPQPIPFAGQLGLWTVPPLIEADILRQLVPGSQTPIGQSSLVIAVKAAQAAAGVSSTQEWCDGHPGEHLWFLFEDRFNKLTSCAACGIIKRADGKVNKPCKGLVRITLREVVE